MAERTDNQEYETLIKEVHPAAESEVSSLLDSLDEEWHSFIPSTFRSDTSFTRNGYRVMNTFVPDMLEVVIRVHKVIKGDAWGMLTIRSHETDGVIRVACMYTMAVPEGFSRWRHITGEQKGNPVTIESRQVQYPEPSEGDSFSDKEVEQIVQDVTGVIMSLVETYEDITHIEAVEYYKD